MSVSNQPPSPLTDYNDLCKAKPVDCFTEKSPCMQPQKDWSRSEWEWHRAGEQHENELKVELSSAASPRAKDGLIKHVALTDEDKLGFFGTSEGGKEQKNAVSVAQSKESCKSWSTSPTNLSASGQYVGEMNPVTGEWSQPTVGRQVNVGGYEIGKEDLTKKRTDKNGELISCSANPILLNPSAALGNPAQNIKNDKISVWNPNFMPDNKVDFDCKQMVEFKDNDKSTLCETDLHSNSIPPYTLTIQKSDTPTMVDYEQDPSDTGNLAHTEDVKVDLVTDSVTRGANQRKMMRRAMSECSHLSVPSSLSISEKYPEPSPGDSLSQSTNSSGSQVPAAGNRKYPKSQIKRSMTVAEEQIPVNSFDADQTAAELQLTDEGHNKESSNAPSDTSDMKGSANTAFNHGRLGKIPEISSTKVPEEKLHGKNEQTGVFTDLQRNDFSGGSVRSLRKETIEVNNVQTSPFSQLQEKPHDSVLLNSAFIETICNSSGLPQNIEMTHYELEQAAEKPQGLAQLNLQHEARFRKSDASSSSAQQPPSVPKAPYSHIESSKTGGGKCSEQSKTADQKGKEPNSTKSCDPVTVTNRELASAQAKPEESSTEGMVGTESAVTSKERPLSTDAKGKTGTPAAKISPTKSKPQPPASLKRPPATTTSPNKKLVTSTSATTAASTSKRVSSSLVRPSSATTKEMKPKATEAKSPVKLPSTRPSSASVTKTASNTTVKSSTTSLQKMPTAPGSTQRNNMLSTPKRPTSIKTEPKSAEMKKSLSAKSPLGETGRPKTASSTSIKSTGTTPSTPSTPMGASTPATPSSNTSRPPRTLALKTTAASEAKRVAPIPRAPSKPTVAAAPKQLRPTSAPAPDLKNVKSKIGSTDNIKHQPGGGKAKPVEKRPEPVRLSRKAESSTVTRVTKTTTMKDSQKQSNGKVQIVNKKIDYSHVQSKCGSKDNIKHVPGGGNVQIPKTKLDVSRASSKCGSKTNLKHKAGGGDVKIETAKTDFKNKAESKIGSLDNLNHIPGGGNVKNEGEEESESATISQIPENGDLTGQAESVTQQNGVGEDPTARSAETHSQELQIQETY
ncbi:hypothetical protein chiPu_0015816 [Chiloscyllium punctatum]|uniref:Microtubule-associated protein n=1 Tax=Chiloscyllium punctatum TaxID=137246 RepID=A0A401T3R9_CHIPU|nr:hypothetical protein [Chiloscyllium punctatum]